MTIVSSIILPISNAITLRRDKSILFFRTVIQNLILKSITAFDILHKYLSYAISICRDLFTQAFDLIYGIKLLCVEHNIDTSFGHMFKLIMRSIMLKIFLSFLCYALQYIGLPHDIFYKIVSIIIIAMLVIAFVITSNRSAFFYNLGIIIIFWLLFGYTVNYFSQVSLSFNDLLYSFLVNYNDQVNSVNSGIPQDMKYDLDSLFSYLNDNLSSIYNGGPGNGGPNGTPPFMFYFDFDSLDEKDKEYYHYISTDHINKFYSEDMWGLNKRYYDQAYCKNFINTYNNSLDYNLTNTHIMKINKMVDHDMLFEHGDFMQTWIPNTDMYKYTIATYNTLLWENDMLDKAKYFCENFDSSVKLNPVYESCHNYWLNRQFPFTVFGAVKMGIPIFDFTNGETFHREVCEDLLWVKLQLLLVNSFITNYTPFDSKTHDVRSIMGELMKYNYFKFKTGYEYLSDLRKLNLKGSSSYAIDFLFEPYKSYFFSLWDEVNVWKKIGLGLSHEFAYAEFDYVKFKHYINPDNQNNISDNRELTVGQEKSSIPYKFSFKTLHNFLYRGGTEFVFYIPDYSYKTLYVKHLATTKVGLDTVHRFSYPGLLDNFYKISHGNGYIKNTSTLGLNLAHKFANEQLVIKK